LTLFLFKKRLKFFVIGFILIIYSFGLIFIGKYSNIKSIIQIKKPVSKNELSSPVESNIPNSDTQSGKVISSFVKLCSNAVYSFEIAYPKDWFTTYNTDLQKCAFFAPYSFVVPSQTDITFVPIEIEPIKSDQWLETVKFYQNPNDFRNVLSSQILEINGRTVQKIKSTTTQESNLPHGFASTTYLLFDSETPLIISYHQLDEKEDVKTLEDILFEMVGSVNFY